jgi:hypothetical protein
MGASNLEKKMTPTNEEEPMKNTQHCSQCGNEYGLAEKLAESERKLERAREDLEIFGRHLKNCKWGRFGRYNNQVCDCGLSQVLKDLSS